ncbi:VPLPA-CTERM sorting domain-containing protein [Sneathiella aquimaris]|uniref:VPLPA-CTERM sorting domain-containing protein n=1 Tax=Sneathiella aquimaris TaxID=2599305 RepID=UPI00146F8E92|nr:VPLPA-CTERM sorting domain-containing protein [Sneathiella aquimaris]
MKRILKAVAVISTAVVWFVSAQSVTAATCTPGASLFNGVSGADLTTSTQCEFHLGNDTNQIGSSINPFGFNDWVLSAKSDGPGGDGKLQLSGVTNGGTSGDWTIADFKGYTTVMLTLKSGSRFAAYLIDTAFNSGEWTTANVLTNRHGRAQGLSHLSVYYSASSLTTVPLPAGLPLFAAGLAGLAFLRRRKMKAAA